MSDQPPSGGCELKPGAAAQSCAVCAQPPSGGCELKLNRDPKTHHLLHPAAFGRLRVETFERRFQHQADCASRLRAAAS